MNRILLVLLCLACSAALFAGAADYVPADGSFILSDAEDNSTTCIDLTITTDLYGYETTWELTDEDDAVVWSGGPYTYESLMTITETNCELGSGCYTLTVYDSYDDGICCDFGDGSYELTANGAVLASGGSFEASESTITCWTWLGCLDVEACNYNADADIDDGSCHYNCQFCLDGTVWSDDQQGCIVANPTDVNLDGCTGISDLLDVLASFGVCNTDLVGWSQLGEDIDGEAEDDFSGMVSLSADGTIVAIGAEWNDGNGWTSGHVRLYQWNGTAWTQLGEDIDGEGAIEWSGRSVSLSSDGSIVAIGAYGNDGNGNASGHVRLYQWNGGAWDQLGEDIDGEAAMDRSGLSVSLSADGSIVAIGAPYNSGNGSESGHVRLYQWSGAAWTQLGEDIDGEAAGDVSGHNVSLSSDGSIVAIGAFGNDGNGANSGHVRLYQWNGAAWNQLGEDIDGEAEDDESGFSVSLSSDGSIVAVGAHSNDGNGNNSGHVRLYQWSGAAWNQLGEDIDGEASGDLSEAVSLSSDGTVVAIGADENDGNGTASGHVRLYEWNGAAWNQVGEDIDGEAEDDRSGYSVSLSSDGTVVAIGAYGNDGNGSDSGHVRVYSFEQ